MTPEELHNIYRTEESFWWYQGMRAITEALLAGAAPARGGRALDAGCGTGFNALALESRYGLRFYGVDLSPLALQYCRQRNFSRAAVASIAQLPFADGCFDLICSFDVLSHLPKGGDIQAVAEFARVLRPGGGLLVRVPAFHVLRSRHSQYIGETHRYHAEELLSMLEANNLQAVRCTYAMMLLSPVSWLKFRIWEPLVRQTPSSGVAAVPASALNKLLTHLLRLEAALIRRGMRLPVGQSYFVLARKSSGK